MPMNKQNQISYLSRKCKLELKSFFFFPLCSFKSYLSVWLYYFKMGFTGCAVINNLPASGGDTRDLSLILGSGRSLGVGNSHSPWFCCLENPMDGGAWWATVHGVL